MFNMRRWVGFSAFVLGVAAVVVLASAINSRRYRLVVDDLEVRVRRGLWLPAGHRPFAPQSAQLNAAYRTVPLPEGMAIARQTQTFFDRVLLDQALHRILLDAARYALGPADPEGLEPRHLDLAERYLDQLSHLPGLSQSQRKTWAGLRRRLGYFKARNVLAEAEDALRSARDKLERAAQAPAVADDAAVLMDRAARAVAVLESAAGALADPPSSMHLEEQADAEGVEEELPLEPPLGEELPSSSEVPPSSEALVSKPPPEEPSKSDEPAPPAEVQAAERPLERPVPDGTDPAPEVPHEPSRTSSTTTTSSADP